MRRTTAFLLSILLLLGTVSVCAEGGQRSSFVTEDMIAVPQAFTDIEAPGDIAAFGRYPQSAEGGDDTPIEWIVLEIQDGKALLISRYGLDQKPYQPKKETVSWETCSLREWLNGEFYETAFDEAEKSWIALSDISAEDNPEYGTDAGNDTQDYVFCLSITEAKMYFADDAARRCAPTDWAKAHGSRTAKHYFSPEGLAANWWWLRSSGGGTRLAAYVHNVGSVEDYGRDVNHETGAVRPAVWVRLVP